MTDTSLDRQDCPTELNSPMPPRTEADLQNTSLFLPNGGEAYLEALPWSQAALCTCSKAKAGWKPLNSNP